MKQHGLGIVRVAMMLVGIMLVGSVGSVQAQAQPAATGPAVRSVTVSGTGRVSAQPDVATITIGVQTDAAQASAALTQNSEQMQALIKTLEEGGVDKKDIQTQAIQLYTPDQQAVEPMPAETRGVTQTVGGGYRAINLVEVRVRDLSKVGALIDQAVQAGGNQIQGIRFELSDPQAALDQARQAAWEDAQHRAEQWAELTGAKLGEVLTINEYQSAIPYAADSSLMRGAASVPVEPGTQTIQVDVQVSWQLE